MGLVRRPCPGRVKLPGTVSPSGPCQLHASSGHWLNLDWLEMENCRCYLPIVM